jgi:LacI family transcriptional regulator
MLSMDGARNGGGKPPTIRDVAARANVAFSSVSRVLSGHPDVSEKMRVRVTTAATELGYKPDFLAQSLRSGHTRTIGFALRDISNPLFANVARRCERDLRRAGYSMIITSSDGDIAAEAENLELFRERHVDAVIASLVSETAPTTLQQLEQLTVPLILLDREVPSIKASALLSDHYAGVRAAVDALLAAGHVRIALITGELDVRSTRERVRAFDDAHAAAGLPTAPDLMIFGTFNSDFAEVEVHRLLALPNPPSAILTGGVGVTSGALLALHHSGLSPETDIAVVALDEWPQFAALAPSIWSVHRDSDEMGAALAHLVLDAMGGAEPRTEITPTEFHPR